MTRLTLRHQADAIEDFGDALAALVIGFDKFACRAFTAEVIDEINAIPNQDHLEVIAEAFRKLGDRLNTQAMQAEEADDRRRDNPLEPDFRRLGQ